MKMALSELRKVKGIGPKAMERVREHLDKSEGDKAYVSEYNPLLHVHMNKLVQGDMLEVMNGIPDKSVDMILTDLPYGTTQNKWDSVINLNKVWKQYKRVIKDDGAIVLFSQPPFDKVLGASNLEMLKYEWIWEKPQGTGHLNAKKMPMKNHENVLVFYKELPVYNPQMRAGEPYKIKSGKPSKNYGEQVSVVTENKGERYPLSVVKFNSDKERLHPTQKPVALLEYLIKTYTNENEVVLDSTMGSGSTGVAAYNTNRKFIGIELDQDYFNIAKERIDKARRVLDAEVHEGREVPTNRASG